MRFIAYMTGASVGSWALSLLVAPEVAAETLLGMLLPLTMGVATVVLATRVSASRLTRAMAQALFVKMLFCALYVVAVVAVFSFDPLPFAISFAAYFICIHLVEAFYLRSLLQSD